MPRIPQDQNQTFLELGLEKFSNRSLFADHFLNNVLPSLTDWNAVDTSHLRSTFDQVVAIFSKAAKHGEATNESQTEEHLVKPILRSLWPDSFEVQCSLQSPDGLKRPDYAFFRDSSQLAAANRQGEQRNFWAQALALGDAKARGDSLDKRRDRDGSPANQILSYLFFSRVRWGILTNGVTWRLYEQDKSRQGGVYYEVNLQDIVTHGNCDAFKWFYLFFRREAFLPDATGRTFLDKVYQGSIDYASALGESLKEAVYDALTQLMNGFFAEPTNGLDSSNPDSVRWVHDQSLIVLYRLLFVLYAEDRRLINPDDDFYGPFSLRTLQREVNTLLRDPLSPLESRSHRIWDHLCKIFSIVDGGLTSGSVEHIPAFNGGLFSAGNHPDITPHPSSTGSRTWKIGDPHIARAIDLLAYSRSQWDQPGEQDVDYSTLDVRHLGSIYEGLLELQPCVAEVDLVEIYDPILKAPTFKPLSAHPEAPQIRGANPRRAKAGEVFLLTSKGERRASGSYYTPHFVVDAIVQRTLSSQLEQASERARAIRSSCEPDVLKIKDEILRLRHDLDALRLQFPGGGDYRRSRELDGEARLTTLFSQLRIAAAQPLQPFLNLKIVDPAMGSGHFLVGAADFISLHLATDPSLFDLADLGYPADQDPQAIYKRMVVEHCLYGVDINPLSVELAKLSLWLHTASGDRALSFLDHHLRCGNSLVGAWTRRDLSSDPPTLTPKGKIVLPKADTRQLRLGYLEALSDQVLDRFLRTFHAIASAPGGTAAFERHKHELFAEMDHLRDRFREGANLWVSPCFGGPAVGQLWANYVEGLSGSPESPSGSPDWRVSEDYINALRIASRERFFHWELEFPDVFFPGNEASPGFDAVIGNPPYVRQEDIPAALKAYLGTFSEAAGGMADLSVAFIELGHHILKDGGRFGMIVTRQFMKAGFGLNIRKWLTAKAHLEAIVDFGELKVFKDASTFPAIILTRKQVSDSQSFVYAPIRSLDFLQNGGNLEAEIEKSASVLDDRAVSNGLWTLASSLELNILDKMNHGTQSLGEHLNGGIHYGVKTGLNEAFVIDRTTRDRLIREDPGCASLIKPFAIGDNIRCYHIRDEGRWLILIPDQWTTGKMRNGETPEEAFVRACPSISRYLEPFEPKAALRYDKGQYWWELRPCIYYPIFEAPKIIYPEMAKEPRFAFDSGGLYTNNKAFSLATGDLALLALLNSSLVWFWLKRNCSSLGDPELGGRLELRDIYLRNLPIPTNWELRLGEDRLSQWLNMRQRLPVEPGSYEDMDRETEDTGAAPAQSPLIPALTEDSSARSVLHQMARAILACHETRSRSWSSFIRWLNTSYGLDIDLLTQGKAILDTPEALDFRAFIALLRKNARTLLLDPMQRSFQDAIYPEFTTAIATIREAMLLAEEVRRLIDPIVCDLYGLDPTETASIQQAWQSSATP